MEVPGTPAVLFMDIRFFMECSLSLFVFLMYFQQQVKQLDQVGALQIGREKVIGSRFLLHFSEDKAGFPVFFTVERVRNTVCRTEERQGTQALPECGREEAAVQVAGRPLALVCR